MLEVLPDISLGLGFGTTSLAAVFFYLYKNERYTNKKLVADMFTALLNNTQVMTELRDVLRGKSVCPLSGTDALTMLDTLRKR